MNIMIVEDDVFLASKIIREFEKNAPTNIIKHISSYDDFLHESAFKIYDIILLDICLGNNIYTNNGFTILSHIRTKSKTVPIIMISNMNSYEYLEDAFSRGAHDYLVKPFRIKELQIRIQRWFHSYVFSEFYSYEKKLIYHELQYIPISNEFVFCNEKIKLSKSSKYLLSIFLINKETLLSQSFLSEKIWGYSDNLESKNLRIKILRLKKSLEPYGVDSRLKTIHGEGYVFGRV